MIRQSVFARCLVAFAIVSASCPTTGLLAEQPRALPDPSPIPAARQQVWHAVVAALREQGSSEQQLPRFGDIDLPGSCRRLPDAPCESRPPAGTRALGVPNSAWNAARPDSVCRFWSTFTTRFMTLPVTRFAATFVTTSAATFVKMFMIPQVRASRPPRAGLPRHGARRETPRRKLLRNECRHQHSVPESAPPPYCSPTICA